MGVWSFLIAGTTMGKIMTDAKLSIEMHHTTSNREPFYYTKIVISDAVNRHVIAEVQVNKEQFYDLLTGHRTSGPLEGFVIGHNELRYLNQETHAFARTFERPDRLSFKYDDDLNAVPVLVDWANAMQARILAHRWRWSRRNNGINLTFWRYETGLTESAVEDIEATLQAAVPPEGLQ